MKLTKQFSYNHLILNSDVKLFSINFNSGEKLMKTNLVIITLILLN